MATLPRVPDVEALYDLWRLAEIPRQVQSVPEVLLLEKNWR
jgi:hypothetical protein